MRRRSNDSRRSAQNNVQNVAQAPTPSFPLQKLTRNTASFESDTDFLCDRTVEFMESGEACSIVAVEIAQQSVYFDRLLRYHHGRGCLKLPEFLNAGFNSVIEFIHCGNTDINSQNVYDIFIAADYLLVPKLKQKCSEYIHSLADDPSTAISLWITCRSLYWPEIGKAAFKKILENFEKLWQSKEYLQLSYSDVKKILENDGLNCKKEKHLLDAILFWLNNGGTSPDPERSKFAINLLLCIRLGMLTQSELSFIRNHQFTMNTEVYHSIVQYWPRLGEFETQYLNDVKIRRMKTPRLPHEVILVFGGWCDGEGPRAAAQIFNPRANTWTLWSSVGRQAQEVRMPQTPAPGALPLTQFNAEAVTTFHAPESAAVNTGQVENSSSFSDSNDAQVLAQPQSNCHIGEVPRRVYAGCVLIGSQVYLIGGFDGTNALKSTMCYDFETDSGWFEKNCMYEKRYYVSVTHYNGYVYALGGHNGENQGRLDTAERYNLQENLWRPIAPMNKTRSDAGAAEAGGRVYIVGGFEGRRYHDSAEFYDPNADHWTLINRMHSPRGGVSVAQHDGYIYAIGGNDGSARLRTIERFDPRTSKWEVVGNMSRRKSNLSSTVIDDDIYIIGGWSDEPEAGILDAVERFDTTTRESQQVRSLCFPASATCACTFKDRRLVRKYIHTTPCRNTDGESNPGTPIPENNTTETLNNANNLNYNIDMAEPPYQAEAVGDVTQVYLNPRRNELLSMSNTIQHNIWPGSPSDDNMSITSDSEVASHASLQANETNVSARQGSNLGDVQMDSIVAAMSSNNNTSTRVLRPTTRRRRMTRNSQLLHSPVVRRMRLRFSRTSTRRRRQQSRG